MQYHSQMVKQMEQYEENQKIVMLSFFEKFDDNILSYNNFDVTINSILEFANQTGIALQHVDFDEF